MSKAKIIFVLAGWAAILSLFGLLRNGAIIPILINGMVALRVSILGWFTYKGNKRCYYLTMIWLCLSALSYCYIGVFESGFYEMATWEAYMISGSMAAFCMVTFVVLLKAKNTAKFVSSKK